MIDRQDAMSGPHPHRKIVEEMAAHYSDLPEFRIGDPPASPCVSRNPSNNAARMSLKDLVVGRPSSSPPAAPIAPDLADAEATQERAALVDDDEHEGATTVDSSA